MNSKTTTGQYLEDKGLDPRQMLASNQMTHALNGPVVALHGSFRLRPSTARLIDGIVQEFIGRLEVDNEGMSCIHDSESRVAIGGLLSSVLNGNLRESAYPFNLFSIHRPSEFRATTDQALSLLAWGVGFGKFEAESNGSPATQVTRRDFECLRTPSYCLAFARKWGRLGPASQNLYFVAESRGNAEPGSWVSDLLESELWPKEWTLGAESSLLIPLTGEPLDAWLWHSGRLRAWRTLLSPIRNKRDMERFTAVIDRYTDTLAPSVESGKTEHMRPSLDEGLRSVSVSEVEALKVEPWSYALHQEGGDSYFEVPEFDNLRRAARGRHRAGGLARMESAAKATIAKLLRRTLAGHIEFTPRIGIEDRESIQTDSLLTWLYLEFAREFAFGLGSVRTLVECIVCDKKVTESPHVRNRRRFCGGSCQKLFQRYGLDEARARVKML